VRKSGSMQGRWVADIGLYSVGRRFCDSRHRGKHPIYIPIPAAKLDNKLIHPRESMSDHSIAMVLSSSVFPSTLAQGAILSDAACELDDA